MSHTSSRDPNAKAIAYCTLAGDRKVEQRWDMKASTHGFLSSRLNAHPSWFFFKKQIQSSVPYQHRRFLSNPKLHNQPNGLFPPSQGSEGQTLNTELRNC